MMEILIEVNGVLHAFLVDFLAKISMPVQQTDCDEVQVKVARRFAMVAGENTEAARIIRNRFVEAELGGKISDRFLQFFPATGLPVSIGTFEIFAECIFNEFKF